jgi:hypothetical protein
MPDTSDEAVEAAAKAIVEQLVADELGWVDADDMTDMTIDVRGFDLAAAVRAAAPHLVGERKLVRTYYRSVTADGELWCESKDPQEVRQMSEGKDCAFEVIHYYETTDGWQEWARG